MPVQLQRKVEGVHEEVMASRGSEVMEFFMARRALRSTEDEDDEDWREFSRRKRRVRSRREGYFFIFEFFRGMRRLMMVWLIL